MIFSCPSCGASHFKPDAEVEIGADVVCRRCRHEFRVTLEGVVSDESADTGAGEAWDPSGTQVTNIDDVPTSVMEAASSEAESDDADEGPIGEPPTERTEIARADELEADLADDPFDGPDLEFAPGGTLLIDQDEFTSPEKTDVGARLPPADAFDSAERAPQDALGPIESVAGPNAGDEALAIAREASRGGTVGIDDMDAELARGAEADRDFDDDLTGIHPSEQSIPAGSFETMAVPTGGEGDASPMGRAVRGARASAGEVGQAFMASSMGVKAGVGLAALTLIVVTWLIASSLGPSGPSAMFIGRQIDLRTGPGLGDGYDVVAVLPAGTEVTAYEAATSFTLVRDSFGRVGFVANESLVAEAPIPNPAQPFAGCRQSPIEATHEVCEARAQAQFERCETGCEGDEKCNGMCSSRRIDCLAGCDTRLVVVKPQKVAEVEPEPDPPEPVSEASPEEKTPVAAADEPAAVDAADKPEKKTKKKKRRKKRKKKRR